MTIEEHSTIFVIIIFFTKLSKIALQRSEEARILFRSNVCLLDPEMFVFLDESGFDKRLSRSYGYSPVGTRATVKRQAQNWGPRITAISIICMEGMVEVGIYQGNVDGTTQLSTTR